MNVYDPIYYWSRVAPNRAACAFPGGTVTYSQLCNGADAAASTIQRAGFRPRELINIAVVNPVFQLVLFIALGRLGIPAAMITPGREAATGALKITGIITDNPKVSMPGGRNLAVDHNWFVSRLGQTNAPRPEPFPTQSDDLVRLVSTSGSTGISKALALTQGMIEERLRTSPILPEGRRALSMVPPQGSWGYLIALKLLRSGGTFCFAPFPNQCLDLCDSFDIEVICASVAQAASLIGEQKRLGPRDLLSMRRLLVGGSHVSPVLVTELQSLIARDVAITYGATEAGQIASAPTRMLLQTPGAVGFLHPGAQIEIVDETGRALPPGRSGAIRIKGAGAAAGYLAAGDDADGIFHDGWFYPGDIGSVTRDGMLVVEGRTSELVLNKGGMKLNPALLEEQISGVEDISDVGLVAGESASGVPEIWAAIVTSGSYDAGRLKKMFDDKLGGYAPDRYFKVAAIPRNEIGKTQYKILREQLLALATEKH